MRKYLTKLLFMATFSLITFTGFSQLNIQPPTDTDTIVAEVGDIVLGVDSNYYAFDGVQWTKWGCDNTITVGFAQFNGIPSQSTFQSLYGLPLYNFEGYIRNDVNVFSFVYIEQTYYFNKMNH